MVAVIHLPLSQITPEQRCSIKISTVSRWSDSCWEFEAHTPGTLLDDKVMRWAFTMPDASVFTDPQWNDWLEAGKCYIWSLYTDPPQGRGRASVRTLCQRFRCLRVIIQWFAKQGYRCFADIDQVAIEQLLRYLAKRPGKRHDSLSQRSLMSYVTTLRLLYLQRNKIPDGLLDDPFAGETDYATAKTWSQNSGNWPYTPDEIAIPLVQGALRLIGTPADDVIALRNQGQTKFDAAIADGKSHNKAIQHAMARVSSFSFSILAGEQSPWYSQLILSSRQIPWLVAHILDACFVIIAYLTGARVSEILGLQAGCTDKVTSVDGGELFTYLRGKLWKIEERPHRWVAPEPVIRAVDVLEQLSAPYRKKHTSSEMFLIPSNVRSFVTGKTRFSIIGRMTINTRLNTYFGPFLGLPLYKGARWQLSSHQGRKTFARFMGRHDRTHLYALQKHLGHVARAMTDASYVGTDHDLSDLIEQQAQAEMALVLEDLLTAEQLSGPKGKVIMASLGRFRGRTERSEVQTYIKQLMEETELRVSACDWGYCIYRQETSACHGDHKSPNKVLRTVSVCTTCKNFSVTEAFRPFWERRRDRNAELLQRSDLDPVSRDLCQARVEESEKILAGLERTVEENHNATP